MKIGVAYVGYITNLDLMEFARRSLASITSQQHKLIFEGWLNHPISEEWRAELEAYGTVRDNDENCLGKGWNRGIESLLGAGCDYVFVPNLDIELRPDSLDTLVAGAESRPDFLLWTMSPSEDRAVLEESSTQDLWEPHPHFSAFLVNERTLDVVGYFDEAFKPAYDEDLDYHWRINLAGFKAGQYEGARFYHVGSATIRYDEKIRETNSGHNGTHAHNDDYFIRKWGRKPDVCCWENYEGLFRYPFNDPDYTEPGRRYKVERRTWRERIKVLT